MAESEPQSSAPDEAAEETQDSSSAASRGTSLLEPLKSKQVAIPLAASAVTAAAVFGARRGPDAVRSAASKVKEGGAKLREKGSETTSEVAEQAGKSGAKGAKDELAQSAGGGVFGKVASKAFGGGGGGGGGGDGKKTRRLPIQRWTDVAVPVDEAYEKWTSFEDFPKFMHRVLSVEHEEGEGDANDRVKWQEKIWFSKRQWEAEITEQNENDRIAWRTVSGTNHSGVVSFHELDDNLTRVLVTVDFRPTGLFEKMGSGLRFAKRAVQADLARFKAYAELGREATGEEPEAREQREQREQEEKREKEREETSARGDGDDDEAADQGPRASSDDERSSDEEARREREARRAERREKVGT
jgi:uncharacterized membrane protein